MAIAAPKRDEITMAIHKPSWFSEDTVMICTAPTCGLTKGGRLLPRVDRETGKRVQVLDEETGEYIDAVDDRLADDMLTLLLGGTSSTLNFVPVDDVHLDIAVPCYYDNRYIASFREALAGPQFEGFSTGKIGGLKESSIIQVLSGHGSPSQDQRVGEIPYIKVSDLRAGLVNINPTNRVPLSVARYFWGGNSSGLHAFDLLCPERTSKNIGDFCVLMPGQEQVVTTKEVIVLRPGPNANFDAFYLLWAMTLKIVKDQWKRVIFMQTNREDVGNRYLEIEIPLPPNRTTADKVSKDFREYYMTVSAARTRLSDYLHSSNQHHYFMGSSELPIDDDLLQNSGLAEEA
jgi:type I restriction enzyme M protein